MLFFSYAFVLLNDFFTSGNGIITKQKLDIKDLGKSGLLYYNCLFMIPPSLIVFFMTENLSRIIGDASEWRNNDSIWIYFKSLKAGATRYLCLSSFSPASLVSSWCCPSSSAPATTLPSPPASSAASRISSSPTLVWSSGETTGILSLTSLVFLSVL